MRRQPPGRRGASKPEETMSAQFESAYAGMQCLGSGEGGFPQFYKRPGDDFVTLGHDPPTNIAPEAPPGEGGIPQSCFQIKRRRHYDQMMKKSKEGPVIMCCTTAWDLYFAIPWFDALAHEEDTTATLCKVDLDGSFVDFITDKYDCQYRPTYFYIEDGEVVDTTLGDTETTVEYLTHWAKHGKAKPGLVQAKVPDAFNPEGPDDADGENGAEPDAANGADGE